MAQSNTSSGGVGIFGLMFLIFMTLKLIGTIDWSWWWVTAPLWGPVAFVVAIVIIVAVLKAGEIFTS